MKRLVALLAVLGAASAFPLRAEQSVFIGSKAGYCVGLDGQLIDIRSAGNTGIDDATALVDGPRPIILVDARKLAGLQPWFQTFLFYRQCGLHQQGVVKARSPIPEPTYDKEVLAKADCFAMAAVLKHHGSSDSNWPQLVHDRMVQKSSSTRYVTSVPRLRACLDSAMAPRASRR